MRKVLFTSIVTLVIGIVSFFIWKIFKIERIRKEAFERIQKLPELKFKFEKPGFESISGKPVIINFFSPDCEHCQYMISEIVKHKVIFSKAHIFMISPAKVSEVSAFKLKYGLDTLKFITVGRDTSFTFFKTFGSTLIPSFYVYSARHDLDTVFRGETKIENLVNRID